VSMRYVFPTHHLVRYRFPTHANDLVMDRAEAEATEAFMVVIEPGHSTPLHVHYETEQIFYVTSGAGQLQIGDERATFSLSPGDLARIPRGTKHAASCSGDEPLVYLSIDCFPGGRPQAEPTWESHVAVAYRTTGWQIERSDGPDANP
jgi:quercetin dioxygenase-like cupin family protein